MQCVNKTGTPAKGFDEGLCHTKFKDRIQQTFTFLKKTQIKTVQRVN